MICRPESSLRGDIMSDLAVVAAADGDLDQAARLASDVLAHKTDHSPALEIITHCETIRQERAATHSRELQRARIAEYGLLCTCVRVNGEPVVEQPLLLLGRGQICFRPGVQFGWRESPGFYDQYCYVEASHRHTRIEIGSNTLINNGVTLRAEGPGISIGADCLFGWNVQVLDSDFHDLHPARRRNGAPATGHVRIGNNTFLGANTIVTKGVSIGDDTMVGAGSLVVQSLPAGVIAAGTPAKVIRELDDMPLTPSGDPAARRAS
jgi:maltose O-acetyltransferase